MNCLVSECVELGVPYLYDPSQQIVRMDAGDLRRGVEGAQSLFLNEYEFGLLQKHTGMTTEEILSHLEYMVITLAEEGAMIYAEGETYRIPVVKPEQMVEPTRCRGCVPRRFSAWAEIRIGLADLWSDGRAFRDVLSGTAWNSKSGLYHI